MSHDHRKYLDNYIESDPVERLEIRKRAREFYDARSLQASDKFVANVHDTRVRFIGYSVDFAKIFINSLLILNGGGIVALLTFLGTLFGKGDIKTIILAFYMSSNLWAAFAWFAAGLAAAVACAGITYVNWMASAGSHQSDYNLFNWHAGRPMPEGWDAEEQRYEKFIIPSAIASVIIGAIGGLCFIGGSFKVLQVFSGLDFFGPR